MVNVTNAPAQGSSPASSLLPDTLVGFQHDTSQYTYASAPGTLNDVNGGFPRFVGNIRLAVTLAGGSSTWTGLGAGLDGQHVVLWNTDTVSTLTLSVADSGSLPLNRFEGPSGNTALGPGVACELVYYAGLINAWVISSSVSSGGGGGVPMLVSVIITAASENDYDPGGGFPTQVGYLNINPTTNDVTLTGLLAGIALQTVVIRNVGITYTVNLSTGGNGQGDPASLPANEFVGQGDAAIPPGGQTTAIYYTSPDPRWSLG